MTKFQKYLEAAYEGEGIARDIDELLEKKLNNLSRNELLEMIDMYVKDVDDEEFKYLDSDADNDEIIDFILSSLAPKQKERLREKLYKKTFK